MSLTPGTRLGAYEILDLLGAGGMGEVYRARDTRLDRTVAIKVLPGDLALSEEVRQRFEREARVISSLNHPHICTLFDVGHQDGVEYLVMEHLEGETLADRLSHGPMPIPELLKTAIEIADALDRAHRQGLVHRDLKPGNIMLTKSGAKLLDFGLARATGLAPTASQLSSPTMSRPLTAEGSIVGTFQYMAPEQLEGKEADARSDIFSLGAVLYEMATGKRAFEGRSQASLIASILKEQPRPISSFDQLTPPALERTVMRCLEKEPDDRYQTARDVMLDLKWISDAGSRAGVAAPLAARRKSRERTAWILAGGASVLALALMGFMVVNRPAKPEQLRFLIPAPPEVRIMNTPKVSPNGKFIAYNATDSTGTSMIWVRPLGSLVAQTLPGTQNAQRPFWSPDSRYLGFMADFKLKKIAIDGGPPQTLCTSASNGDGAWSQQGTILFDGSSSDSIRMVSAAGGTPVPITKIDYARGETGNAWPQFLPDGRHFLFLGLTQSADDAVLKVGDIQTGKVQVIARGAYTRMQYVPPGYILSVRDRALLAQPFDPGRFKFKGDAFPIADDVAAGGGDATNAEYSASDNGVLVFRGGLSGLTRLVWVDRSGHEIRQVGDPGNYSAQTVSPDGNRVAVELSTNGPPDIWVLDASRGVSTRFTFDPADEGWPVWSPTGDKLIYYSLHPGRSGMYIKDASGARPESLLLAVTPSDPPTSAADWSKDGRYLACLRNSPKTSWDVYIMPTAPGAKPYPLIATTYREWGPRFSPDGHWLAYSSNESGRRELYVVPFPGGGGKWQVSTQGGGDAEWRSDGKELFFVSGGGRLMSVDVQSNGTSLQLGIPKVILTGLSMDGNQIGHNYAVSADGQRFLIRTSERAGEIPATNVFVNWTSAIARR